MARKVCIPFFRCIIALWESTSFTKTWPVKSWPALDDSSYLALKIRAYMNIMLQVINNVNFYYDAQKVGTLPNSVLSTVNWIRSSLSQEAAAGPLGRDVSGGWLTGGAAFSTKNTIPTAFAVSMMAWSLLRYDILHKCNLLRLSAKTVWCIFLVESVCLKSFCSMPGCLFYTNRLWICHFQAMFKSSYNIKYYPISVLRSTLSQTSFCPWKLSWLAHLHPIWQQGYLMVTILTLILSQFPQWICLCWSTTGYHHKHSMGYRLPSQGCEQWSIQFCNCLPSGQLDNRSPELATSLGYHSCSSFLLPKSWGCWSRSPWANCWCSCFCGHCHWQDSRRSLQQPIVDCRSKGLCTWCSQC